MKKKVVPNLKSIKRFKLGQEYVYRDTRFGQFTYRCEFNQVQKEFVLAWSDNRGVRYEQPTYTFYRSLFKVKR